MCVDGRLPLLLFFFFQAEDGIRDGHVTGVQTCALPIWAVLTAETEALPDRLGESGRHSERRIGQRDRRPVALQLEDLDGRLPGKGRLAREEEVPDGSESEEVGPRVDAPRIAH